MHSLVIRLFAGFILAFLAGGCVTTNTSRSDLSSEMQTARVAMLAAIPNEPAGDYFVGRRYYKRDYKFWGFVRSPREPWTSAKLVMLNEQQTLAPDRASGKIGSDHDTEYRLYGYFSGESVYEPASNGIYPEFVLKRSEVKDPNPATIYRTFAAKDPTRRIIGTPF